MLEVQGPSDPLVRERLTSELRLALTTDPSLHELTGLSFSASPSAQDGAKGVTDVVALVVAGVPYAKPLATMLGQAISGWCARDRRTTVTVHDGERTIEIVGSPTAAQQELMEKFWRGDSNTTSS
ncbi:hypothetical protein ACFFOU_20560 [Pseudonocardia sulfidoxydans]|uniref:effector-associated constant component EACC1 n=1 Tax=Pseudonocardia sulfidoxydans TaxID=54011 RepID=UPI0011BDBBD3|nr:hypothetical protein [Pseudonocardia sulfidoxydans]